MNSQVFTMTFHTYIAHLVSKSKPGYQENGKLSLILKKVRPQTEENHQLQSQEKDWMQIARKRNTIAKISFIIFVGGFNLVFWSVAAKEVLRPAESYLHPI